MAFRNEYTSDSRKITVDPERGATLRCTSETPDGSYAFQLDWHGQTVSFVAENEIMRRYKNEAGLWRFDLVWTVRTVNIPEGFPQTEDAVCALIAEALDAFGEMHDRERVGIVRAVFERWALKSGRFSKDGAGGWPAIAVRAENGAAGESVRDYALSKRPTGPDPVYEFSLKWQGQTVAFKAEADLEKNKRRQLEDGSWRFETFWTVQSVAIPDNFPESPDVVLRKIAQALLEQDPRTEALTVSFGPRIFTPLEIPA